MVAPVLGSAPIAASAVSFAGSCGSVILPSPPHAAMTTASRPLAQTRLLMGSLRLYFLKFQRRWQEHGDQCFPSFPRWPGDLGETHGFADRPRDRGAFVGWERTRGRASPVETFGHAGPR